MEFKIETPLDAPLAVGGGTALWLRGWCFHPSKRIRKLEVLVDGRAFPVKRHSRTRYDVLRKLDPELVSSGNALNSGFSVLLEFPRIESRKEVHIKAVASFWSGTQEQLDFGSLTLVPESPVIEAAKLPDAGVGPLVAICLATYNPDPQLLAKQIRSLKEQTHKNWICIVNDDLSDEEHFAVLEEEIAGDSRFQVFRNAERQNFYHNFETALRRVPEGVEFISLCDQDDVWNPEKLQASLEAFTPEATMVFSDMKLIGPQGEVISETYWTERELNFSRLETMLLANTITGASSMFRARLLKILLPFPEKIRSSYHDHWLSSAALAVGEIAFIPRPLYGYTQHERQVVGQWNERQKGPAQHAREVLLWMDQPLPIRAKPDSLLAEKTVMNWWVERISLWCSVLLLRGAATAPAKTAILKRWRMAADSSSRMLWEAVRESIRGKAALNLQWLSFFGVLSESMLASFNARQRIAALAALRKNWGLGGGQRPANAGHGIEAAWGHVNFIPRKIAPLNLKVSEQEPRRVNLLTSTIDFKYFFGGYFAVFSLALKLAESGFKVRLVLTDPVDFKPDLWRQEIKKYHGLHDFFDYVEVVPNFERQLLPVSPQDRFMASSWWTAHVAHSGAAQLKVGPLIYLSQDFEPLFYPANSFYALALESYRLPHYALFSTEFLRIYARTHKIGVYANGEAEGDERSISFQNAIEARSPKRERLDREGKKRLLVYARPEEHASRNCFPLAVLGLIGAIQQGYFRSDEWEIHGIGSVQVWGTMNLPHGVDFKLLPKVSLEEYYRKLPEYDLGLSLMLTPHPSLVPLDMAASGLVTVTNTFDIKTADRLRAISSNLRPVEPTISAIKEGLIAASKEVKDLDARIAGAKLNWARSWNEAFNPTVIETLSGWLQGSKEA